MTFSIYHFFRDLLEKKHLLARTKNLEQFPFASGLLSCQNKGVFPDLAIRLNSGDTAAHFTGGELIEIKDSQSYSVASFNSTIPTGTKQIADVVGASGGKARTQMEQAGDVVDSLPERAVYYIVRGRKDSAQKVALVHGSFFETVGVDDLISQSFSQVLADSASGNDATLSPAERKALAASLSDQKNFSKVRHVANASVKLRFRVMTEVEKEGNLLDPGQYPDITDNTLNFVIPLHDASEEANILQKAELAFTATQLSDLQTLKIKHHFNGYFFVFQARLEALR